jgi:1-aminocyclopropane-1-carboxylate deaminase
MQQPAFEPPIQELKLAGLAEAGITLHIKRDDLLHPFVSGNKWRKLKYVIEDAKTKEVNMLVTFGGAWSNHLLATACAGATHGFRTAALVRGEDVSNPVLDLCRLFGMQLHFATRDAYRNKEELFAKKFGEVSGCMMLDEGGKGELAVRGCEELGAMISGFSHVVCAVGTGTTLAGIARGLRGARAVGICVLKGAEYLDAEVSKFTTTDNWTLHHHLHRGGYAKADDEVFHFIRELASSTGILTDHVYTAKMLMGICTLAKEGYFKKGERVLAIHTGGLTGLLGALPVKV